MKFAHMADVHIGSFRDEALKNISMDSFCRAIDICIERELDFILIAGDLFNTALPSIDNLKTVIKKLKALKIKGISVYVIPGSHDYSPSGKTMLDILEEAELLVNVVKGTVEDNILKLRFTVDKMTGAKITGIMGKRGMLDRSYYENLDRESLEKEEGFKIFMFHTAISELKPKEFEHIESSPISLLPKGFNYYAGGHLHFVNNVEEFEYGTLVYPGPVFPANFTELEKLGCGSFFIYVDGELEKIELNTKNVFSINIDAQNKRPEQVGELILEKSKNREFLNTIVTIRVEGVLGEGKPGDIDFKGIFREFYNKGAYFVVKNTNKLNMKEYEDIQTGHETPEEIEEAVINENLGRVKVEFNEKIVAIDLIRSLSREKREDEKQYEYEKRIVEEAEEVIH